METIQNIDSVITYNLKEYEKEVNSTRALPSIRDGMIHIYRRILWTLNKIQTGDSYLKSARLVGEVLGKLHAHGDGSIYGSLVEMVNSHSKLIEGKGNWGYTSSKYHPAAASRYTECKINPKRKHIYKLINEAKLIPGEMEGNFEPREIPMLVPYALLNGAIGVGVGEGIKTVIPSYKYEDLIQRLLGLLGQKKLKTIKPYFGEGIECDGNFEEILTTGIGNLNIYSDIEIHGNEYIIKHITPYTNIESAIKKLEEKYNATIKDGSSKTMDIRIKIRKTGKLTDEKIKDIILNEFSNIDKKFNILIFNNDIDKPQTISVDQWLLYCYQLCKKYYQKKLEKNKKEFELKIEMNHIIELIRPILKTYIDKKDISFKEFIEMVIKNKIEVDEESVDRIAKMTLKQILNYQIDNKDYEGKIKDIEDKIVNIDSYLLKEVYEIN